MRRLFINVLSILLVFFGFCSDIFAAEVLQVRNSSTLIIGDNNRTYTVKLGCLNVPLEKEKLAINFLNSELPRHTRINLMPKGADEGVLFARVVKLSNGIDINKRLQDEGFAEDIC